MILILVGTLIPLTLTLAASIESVRISMRIERIKNIVTSTGLVGATCIGGVLYRSIYHIVYPALTDPSMGHPIVLLIGPMLVSYQFVISSFGLLMVIAGLHLYRKKYCK